jgi:hypothetical protein
VIRINLLPPERRRAERPPARRLVLLAIAGGILGVFFLVNFFGFLRVQAKKGEIETTMAQIGSLRGVVAEYDRLDGEKKQLEGRIKDVAGVMNRPFLWSEVLDALWTVLDEFQLRRGLWVRSLKCAQGQDVESKWRGMSGGQAARGAAPSHMIELEIAMFGGPETGPISFSELGRRITADPVLSQTFPVMTHWSWKVEENRDAAEGEPPFVYSTTVVLFSAPAQPQRGGRR